MMHKTKQELLDQFHRPNEIIDENFVISKNLIKIVENWKLKFVLKKYAEKVSEKIINSGSYCISIENTRRDNRKLITLRIRRKQDSIFPELILDIETKNGKLNAKELKMITDPIFQQKLDSYPKNERYKFPKI